MGISLELTVWLLAVIVICGAALLIAFRSRKLAQPQLLELLITIWIGVTICSALASSGVWKGGTAETPVIMLTVFVVMVCLFGGSAWAWSAARQLGEMRRKPRLILMAKGWLAVVGAFVFPSWLLVGVIFSIFLIFLSHNPHFRASEVLMFLAVGLTGLLLIPAWRVERRLRRQKASEKIEDSAGADSSDADTHV